MAEEFDEIAHSGGIVTFRIVIDEHGQKQYQVRWSHSRPVAAGIIAVYAIPPGIAVAPIDLGGMGQAWNPAPLPGCIPVLIGSDSEGKFGRQCPRCGGYWRSDAWTHVCPYCGIHAERHQFLTAAQRAYVQQYTERLLEALAAGEVGEHEIDMDAVADAAGTETPKPRFYYAEVSQQNKFNCAACGEFNDILGKFGYCSTCGTRNDLQELERTLQQTRGRINTGGAYEKAVQDAVSAFDSLAAQYVRQLCRHVLMTTRRKTRFERMRFHNLKTVAEEIKTAFDIDILDGLKGEEIAFATLMFHRRHVYEHNGGEADEKYIADSGDTTVRPKQALRETQESAHRLVGLVLKMATNLHGGFHDILLPEEEPISRSRRRAGNS